MNNKIVVFLLSLFALISVFLHFYKVNQIPPCINADEAAFGYNAYSISKTAKDEYGAFLPLRFKSFEDYKLPLYTYLSVPFVALFGLNDFATRALNIAIGVAFVPLLYILTKELFGSKAVALISSFLTSLSPGVYILSRHAHEGVIGTFFVLLAFLFLIKYLKSAKIKYFILLNLFLILNAFSYQTGRIYLVFFILLEFLILLLIKKPKAKIFSKICLILFTVGISLFFDFRYGLNRVNNLFFFKNIGFTLRINEYMSEHPVRLIHNKATEAIRDITNRYLSQISPQFLVIRGDTNWRFGFENLGLFTPVEYVFLFIGLYYLFKNKAKFRYVLLFLLTVTPLNNALTWQDASIIRTYVIIFPIIIVISYGFFNFYKILKDFKLFYLLILLLIGAHVFYKYNSFDIYFNHYPKRAVVVRAWQCGYRELVDYLKSNYDKFDKFYITDRHGQPYIFLLYFLKFDPASYQKQAKISAPDKYGFGQIGKFDKFSFSFRYDQSSSRTVFIGYPDEFNQINIDKSKIKKIKIGTEEIFWIYEVS